MEILSVRFRETIMRILDSEAPVIGTIVLRPQPFVDRVKAHARVRVWTLTRDNREDLPGQVRSELAVQGLPSA